MAFGLSLVPEFLGAQGETKFWSLHVHMNHGTLLGIREKNI
jgi:hypothetical protein